MKNVPLWRDIVLGLRLYNCLLHSRIQFTWVSEVRAGGGFALQAPSLGFHNAAVLSPRLGLRRGGSHVGTGGTSRSVALVRKLSTN